jgi:hypothetical protein
MQNGRAIHDGSLASCDLLGRGSVVESDAYDDPKIIVGHGVNDVRQTAFSERRDDG